MRTTTKRVLPLAAAAMVAAPWVAAAPASADTHSGNQSVELWSELGELNDSGVSSNVYGTLEGNQLHIALESSGLLEGAPHAQHIHIGGANQCPDPNMEGTGPNGEIRTTDAADDYGMIQVSLTTEGDTSPDSGLAVERFPVGNAAYERTIEVSDEIAADISEGNGVVVVHGVDHNGNGEYDGEQESDLDPSLPSEATDPAACGVLEASQMGDMPEGGVETGGASTAGVENGGLIALGSVTLGAGAIGLFLNRRRFENSTR